MGGSLVAAAVNIHIDGSAPVPVRMFGEKGNSMEFIYHIHCQVYYI